MTVRSRLIKSCSDASCSRPFVEFSAFKVTAVGIEFTVARCTGPAASAEVDCTDSKERALEKSYVLSFDPTALTEPHVLALTLRGEITFVAQSKQKPVYYAHLAFVNPVTGDADVLSFVDDGQH